MNCVAGRRRFKHGKRKKWIKKEDRLDYVDIQMNGWMDGQTDRERD